VPSSAAGDYAQYQHQYHPWPVKLDRSSVSLKGSECGSTSSVLTAATTVGYCRSLVGFEVPDKELNRRIYTPAKMFLVFFSFLHLISDRQEFVFLLFQVQRSQY
jgi:hypothetical protein